MVAIATGDYDSPVLPSLAVQAEVTKVTNWLSDAARLGDRCFPLVMGELASNPTRTALRDAFEDPPEPWNARDAAVVFVTGHGMVVDGTHWIVLKQTNPAYPAGKALRTADLIDWLNRPNGIQHLILIVDTCFAGAIAEHTVKLDRSLPPAWLILPSASKNGTAELMALSQAIGQAVQDLGSPEGARFGIDDPYFRVSDFVDTVRKHLDDIAPGQESHPLYTGDYNARHVCLPNPHYRQPDTVSVESPRRELALPRQDLERHWRPRALGAGDATEAGGQLWLFTGRAVLMRELIATARGDHDTTSLVTLVTGGAGCGKSAVLARLVTLSDSGFRAAYAAEVAAIPPDLAPDPEHGVDAAVVATGKYPHEVVAQLCRAFDDALPGASAQTELDGQIEELVAAVNRRQKPPTIVVDALDEAQDPHGIIRALTRLATATKMRMLIGVRSTQGQIDQTANRALTLPLADSAEGALNARRLQVDDDPWWNQDDLRAYAVSILLNTPESPYGDPEHHEQAHELAMAIAARIGRSFLVARLAAAALTRRGELVDPSDANWLATLDDDVVGVFRDDLHRVFPCDLERRRAVELLRAVAFSYGRGLPWAEIWPTVANAVANQHGKYGDRDIAELLGSPMGAYLTTDIEDDVTVYRLFHDALRGTLRTDWRRLLESTT